LNVHRAVRRFYKRVTVRKTTDGYAVSLDGKVPRTPGGRALAVPTRALARALADEWRAQAGEIHPEAMPLTQLVNTALDRVIGQRHLIVEQTAAYGASDLLCYRAETPAELAERQMRVWQPLLDWAEVALRAPLNVTQGIIPIAQPSVALVALQNAVAALDVWRLTALQGIVPALGSLVLGMAVVHRRLSPQEALAASLLDETFQAERWGIAEETRIRHAILTRDMAAAVHLLADDDSVRG
jgi:chaperone required for assembly of F1-ATPase